MILHIIVQIILTGMAYLITNRWEEKMRFDWEDDIQMWWVGLILVVLSGVHLGIVFF
jgi:hypothetical protein